MSNHEDSIDHTPEELEQMVEKDERRLSSLLESDQYGQFWQEFYSYQRRISDLKQGHVPNSKIAPFIDAFVGEQDNE